MKCFRFRAALPLAMTLALAAPLAFAQSTAPAAPASTAAAVHGPWSADQVRAMLMRQGYTAIETLKLDDGHWKAKARRTNGDWENV
ncbi:MAG TPA: PepSY domain-containing protein [Rhodanobacteraceae bacterium]|nr:PepSY domain-containing protein [Rhodanobacteraceae bacterium]